MSFRSAIYTTFTLLAFPNFVLGQMDEPVEVSDVTVYTIRPEKSQFTVYAFRGGLFGRFGHDHTIAIRDFEGEITLMPDVIEPAKITLTVQTKSLKVIDDIKEDERQEIEHNMYTKVLVVDQYPEIVYHSEAITVDKMAEDLYDATMVGSLDLHGVNRPKILTAQVTIDGDMLRATGEFMVKQKDYNIKPISVLGGTIKVKNELKFTFDIIAERQ
jgi:polyisoprenoid-binding protein YceI